MGSFGGRAVVALLFGMFAVFLAYGASRLPDALRRADAYDAVAASATLLYGATPLLACSVFGVRRRVRRLPPLGREASAFLLLAAFCLATFVFLGLLAFLPWIDPDRFYRTRWQLQARPPRDNTGGLLHAGIVAVALLSFAGAFHFWRRGVRGADLSPRFGAAVSTDDVARSLSEALDREVRRRSEDRLVGFEVDSAQPGRGRGWLHAWAYFAPTASDAVDRRAGWDDLWVPRAGSVYPPRGLERADLLIVEGHAPEDALKAARWALRISHERRLPSPRVVSSTDA